MCVDIVIRLKEFMKYTGLPSTQFADCAKIARPTISQLLNGRNRKISNELISKLHYAFPELNILWLMFGDGEMINKVNANIPPMSASIFSSSVERQPPYDDVPRNTTVVDNTKKSVNTTRRENNGISYSYEPNSNNETYDFPSENTSPQPVQIPITPNPDMSKRIKSIMVFYTDSSFEIFTPSNL